MESTLRSFFRTHIMLLLLIGFTANLSGYSNRAYGGHTSCIPRTSLLIKAMLVTTIPLFLIPFLHFNASSKNQHFNFSLHERNPDEFDKKKIRHGLSSTYLPATHAPALSHVWNEKIENGNILLVRTSGYHTLWAELCVSAQDGSPTLEDCFSANSSLQISFPNADKTRFNLLKNGLCLSLSKDSEALSFQDCKANDASQSLEMKYSGRGFNDYNEYKFQAKNGRFLAVKNSANGGKLTSSDGPSFFHFRDPFPLLPIQAPITQIPSKEDFEKARNTSYSAQNTPSIIMIVVDSLRKEFVSPEIMPNLHHFSNDNGIGFSRAFSGATATFHTFFSLWNSRPAYEKDFFDASGLRQNGSLFFNILKNLGYRINIFGGFLDAFDEGLYRENQAKNAQLGDVKCLHAEVFTKQHEACRPSHEFAEINNRELDDKIIDHATHVFERSEFQLNPTFFAFYFSGLHSPYGVNKNFADKFLNEPLKKYPSFFYNESNSKSQIEKEWLGWYYQAERSKWTHYYSYENSARYLDHQIGKVLEGLKKNSLYENSTIVIMADHSESLGENHRFGHGGGTQHRVVNIPLFFRFPTKVNKPITAQVVSTLDVIPTLLDTMELEQKEQNTNYTRLFKGKSIFAKSEKDLSHECKLSVSPNDLLHPIEFSILLGDMKLRARFRYKQKENGQVPIPIESSSIEPISLTDFFDEPVKLTDIKARIETLQKFTPCLTHYFGSPAKL